MYNNGNSSKNVTGASVVDGSLENADYADNAISGDKIDAGIISNFQSTGIDDRLSTGKVLTLSDSSVDVNTTLSLGDNIALSFGDNANGDLIIKHDGANSVIRDRGDGDLLIEGSSNLILQNFTGSKKYFVGSNGGASTIYHNGIAILETTSSGVKPVIDNTYDLGTASRRWEDVYATNGTIQTSDERQKDNITPTDLGLDFINSINPVKYKWKDYSDTDEETGEVTRHIFNRTHYGMIAQDVETVLGDKDFAGFIYNEESDRYGLRYTEFVAPLIKAIQELTARIEQLENNK
jgi:hypothetical protein